MANGKMKMLCAIVASVGITVGVMNPGVQNAFSNMRNNLY